MREIIEVQFRKVIELKSASLLCELWSNYLKIPFYYFREITHNLDHEKLFSWRRL